MDYKRLLNFYLACVEEEDLRSKQVNAGRHNRQYIVPGQDAGELFRNAEHICWSITDAQKHFLDRYALEIEKSRFLYGYPVYRDGRGFLLPLFMAEVEVELDQQRINATLRLIHPSTIQVNLHLFRSTHPSMAERLGLQDTLESHHFGTFEARLQKALEVREEQYNSLEELVTPRGTEGWKNASLVFRDTGGAYTNQLRRELAQMKQIDLSKKAAGTALETLFESGNPKKAAPDPPKLLEIVPLNKSQRAAATAALSQALTVITGPPGTGKSQVVIDLVASMEASGRRVVFASKNNRAVDVVRERIAEILESDDWTLRFGNRQNIDEERQVRNEQAMRWEQDEPATIIEKSYEYREHLNKRESLENESMDVSSAVAKYADSLAALRRHIAELPHAWQEWWDSEPSSDWPELKHKDLVRKNLEDLRALSSKRWPGLWLWFLRFLSGPRLRRKYEEDFIKLSGGGPNTIPQWSSEQNSQWQDLLDNYQVLHNLHQSRRASEDVDSALSNLVRMRLAAEFREKFGQYSEIIKKCSRDTCRVRIRNRITPEIQRLPTFLNKYFDLTEQAANPHPNIARQIQMDFSRAANTLLNITSGVIVTSLSARRSLPFEPKMFDCLIIDEASQCDIASALPLLLRAKRLVVIGDPQQLRHVSSINDRKEQELAHSEGAANLFSRYSYRKKSLFDCAAETCSESGGEPFFLAEHYRSQPEIIEFSNRTYYRPNCNVGLIIRTPLDEHVNNPVLWHDIPSEVDRPRGSLLNHKEARKVAEIADRIVRDGSLRDEWTIGIVTPYNRQRNYIESLLKETGSFDMIASRLKVGNVHTFQGSEADIMIFSPVVANGADVKAAEWISNEEGLLNVALTRARKILHIVGDKSYCAQTPGPLGELAKFVDQLSGEQHRRPEKTDARPIVRKILKELGHWFQEERPESDGRRHYDLDFVIVGLSGTQYNIEIDGHQHLSAEAIMNDDARDAFLKTREYVVIRFRAGTVERHPDIVRSVLSHLA